MNVNIKINSLVKLMTHLCLLTILFQNCKMKDEQNKSTATSSSQPQIVLSNLTNYINVRNPQLN